MAVKRGELNGTTPVRIVDPSEKGFTLALVTIFNADSASANVRLQITDGVGTTVFYKSPLTSLRSTQWQYDLRIDSPSLWIEAVLEGAITTSQPQFYTWTR